MTLLHTETGDHLHDLTNLTVELRSVQVRIESKVKAARAAGAEWQEIGAALGISKQAAHKRFRSVEGSRGR